MLADYGASNVMCHIGRLRDGNIVCFMLARVGTKTLFWPFAKMKTFTKGAAVCAKFCQFFAKVFCENFSRKPQSEEKWYKISVSKKRIYGAGSVVFWHPGAGSVGFGSGPDPGLIWEKPVRILVLFEDPYKC
jgi:hypothetical protein